MKVNLVLGAKDLGSTRLAISPLQNLIIGACGHQPSRSRQEWWRRSRRHIRPAAEPLLELIDAHPWYVPDFLTPTLPGTQRSTGPSADQELDALRFTTDAQIHTDLQCYDTLPGVARSVLHLREGGTRQMARIVDAARSLFRTCLAEDWPGIQHHLRADVAHRAALMASLGPGQMLNSLSSRLRWRDDNTLAITLGSCGRPTDPQELTISLSGNGLVLMPSPFVAADTINVTGSVTASRQAVLAYGTITTPPVAGDHDTLVLLVGRGRARALRAIQGAVTTTELARSLGVGASTASEHATALRAARLITTHRIGRNVHHTLTDLGNRLLTDNPRRAASPGGVSPSLGDPDHDA